MTEHKRYYKITKGETGEQFYAAVNLPVTSEQLIELLGISGKFTAEEISKYEYDANTDSDESIEYPEAEEDDTTDEEK